MREQRNVQYALLSPVQESLTPVSFDTFGSFSGCAVKAAGRVNEEPGPLQQKCDQNDPVTHSSSNRFGKKSNFVEIS